MLVSTELTVPANTTKGAPFVDTLQLGYGVLRKCWVRWRYGVGDLAGCRISYHSIQIYPHTLNQWLPSFRESLEWDEYHLLDVHPYEFRIDAYNEDDSYEHKLWVAFLVIREQPVVQRMDDIITLVGGLYGL